MSDGSVLAMSDQAWSLVESGRMEEARSLFKNICEIDGNDPEPWMMLGSLHAEFMDMQDAIACLQKSIELDPAYPDAHLNLAKALVKQDQIEAARKHCQIAVDNDPSYVDAWQLLGVIQERLGNFIDSEMSSRKAVELAPGNASCHANLALALWKQNKLQESIQSYQRTLQLAPRLVDAWMQLAAVHYHLDEFSEAENCYKKAIELEPQNAAAYGRLGDILSRQKRRDEAIELFHKALAIQPGDTGLLLLLGWAQHGKQQWDDAIRSFQAVVAIDPKHAQAYFGLGSVYAEQGTRDAAVAHFQRGLEFDPHNEQIQFHISHLTGSSPATAPTDYVRSLFDDYADHFDSHLVGELSYQAPTLVHAAVMEVLGQDVRKMDIQDLGCGTGLCAPLFKDHALKLSGIDLSEKMVEAARQRGLYDHLVVGDIAVALEGVEAVHDLIIAADVFVYVGELSKVFGFCAIALKPAGLFAFTVEAAKDDIMEFALQPSGRYAHSKPYLANLAQSNGLEVILIRDGILRTDRGKPIHGYTVVIQRP